MVTAGTADGSAGDSRQDLARYQLDLAPLIAKRPEVDPLAARAGI
jgi:hypothetical protein